MTEKMPSSVRLGVRPMGLFDARVLVWGDAVLLEQLRRDRRWVGNL